jgi:hypothetical protein
VLQGFIPASLTTPLERRAALASGLIADVELFEAGCVEARRFDEAARGSLATWKRSAAHFMKARNATTAFA